MEKPEYNFIQKGVESGMDFAIDQSFYAKAKAMLDRMEKNQKLQQVASANGIDIKNSAKLTDATKNNISTSVIALLLAKHNNDPRYGELVKYGMDHRKAKIDLINAYKDQANQIIARAKNNDFNTLSGFAESATEVDSSAEKETESSSSDDDDEDHHYQESVLGIGAIMSSLGVSTLSMITAALSVLIYGISSFLKPVSKSKANTVLKRLQKIPEDQRKDFSIDVELKWKVGEFLSVEDISDIIYDFEDLVNYTIIEYEDTKMTDYKFIMKWNDFDMKYQKLFARVKHMKIKPDQSDAKYKKTLNYDEAVEYAKKLQSIDLDKLEKTVDRMKKHLKKINTIEANNRGMKNSYYAKDIHKYEINKTTRDFTIKKTCMDVQRMIIPIISNYADYLNAIIKKETKKQTTENNSN
jgi:hypothetical protein